VADTAPAGWCFSRVAALGLLALGLLQMAGQVLRLPRLAGIAAATAASPAPRRFSPVRGLETFSSQLHVVVRTSEGRERVWPITPERYAGLVGPCNRRDVFGAVLADGPVLASDPRMRPLFEAVSEYALCRGAPLLGELDIPTDGLADVRVLLVPRAGIHPGEQPLALEPSCEPPERADPSAP